MRAQEFITERKKRSKKTRGLGGYFFPGYGFYGGDAGEGGGDGGGGGESKQGMLEAMAADQVLDYVKRAHAPEAFDIEYSITDHPKWELKNIPLSQLNLDPDGEEPDPYNRVNWVDNDKVQDLIPQIEAILKRMPIVVDPRGWIIDGNHRAMAAGEAGLTNVPALVPVKPGVTEGKVKLYTDPGYFGAEVDDAGFDSLPVINISADRLVGFEPDSKMNQPKSQANVKKIVAGLKKGDKLPPLLVRKYKNGYQVLDGHHRFWAYKLSGTKSIPVRIVADKDIEEISKQGVAEDESNDTAISLSKLGKFHPGADTLAQFVPERATAQYALHPDKWESTFYSLTNKDSDKLKYYGPKKISIPPGTLVGDMAIANKFYRAKTPEEQEQYAELYKASLQPYPVDVSQYRMPELLIPKQGVAEGKQPGKSVTDAIQKVLPIAQEIWFHGSRATGKHRRNSDTDILVVVPDDLVGDQYLAVVRTLQKLSSIFDNYDIQPTKSGTNIHRIAQEEGQLLWSNKQDMAENFADGRVKGKSRPGRVKRAGASCDGSVTSLRAKARKYGGERGKMYHWCANMKGGKK